MPNQQGVFPTTLLIVSGSKGHRRVGTDSQFFSKNSPKQTFIQSTDFGKATKRNRVFKIQNRLNFRFMRITTLEWILILTTPLQKSPKSNQYVKDCFLKNLNVLLRNTNNLFGYITKFNLKKEFSIMNSISGDCQIRCRKTTAFSSKDIALINIKHTYLRILHFGYYHSSICPWVKAVQYI